VSWLLHSIERREAAKQESTLVLGHRYEYGAERGEHAFRCAYRQHVNECDGGLSAGIITKTPLIVQCAHVGFDTPSYGRTFHQNLWLVNWVVMAGGNCSCSSRRSISGLSRNKAGIHLGL